jgi:hypothetical protein
MRVRRLPSSKIDLAGVVRHPNLARRREHASKVTLELLRILVVGERPVPERTLGELALAGRVVKPEHDVLRRVDDRLAVGGREDVVRAHHEHAGFHLRLDRERHVHGHLVAVEVRVERGADERVQLDGLAFDENGLERLDAESVQRRRSVQHDRVLADDLFEDVPNLGTLLLDHLLGALDGVDVPALFELVVDERLEELEGHLLGQAALVELQRRTDDDDRAARVVDALAEQVLTEPALLALQHVGEALQGALVGPGDRLAAAAVVEQGVDRFLQHAALVADDDLGSVQLEQALQAVVPVDDAAVEVVEVAGREPAAVERHEGPQIRGKHRDDGEHHPFGAVAALAERLDHLEALGDLLTLGFAGRLAHLGAKILGELVHVLVLQHLEHGFAAHARGELVLAVLFDELEVALLGQQLAQREAGLLRIDDDVGLAVEDLLEVLQRDVEHVADARRQALQEPDVRDRCRQVDVSETLAAHLRLDDFDAALLAHDPAMLHALVLAAVALVVLHRAEDLGAEEPIAFWLERPVVDGLRLLDLAV